MSTVSESAQATARSIGGVIAFDVEGMTCASCAARIERVLAKQPGVDAAAVNFAGSRARVTTTSGSTPSDLIEAVAKIGYNLTVSDPADHTRVAVRYRAEERAQWRRFWIAAALTLPTVVLAMFSMMNGPGLWAQFLLATPVVLWAGAQFHRIAWKQARSRTVAMDTLISLGSLTAYLWSVWAMFNHGVVFFETGAVIVTLIVLGRALEARAKGRASSAVTALLQLQPATARIKTTHGERMIEATQVIPGDLMVVYPGEQIPTDGVIVEGSSSLDESMLTGESTGASKGAGADVFGATVNQEGLILVRATRIGEETALSRIVALVEEAQAGKAPVQRLADRIASVFVPAVILIALGTLITWLIIGNDVADAVRAAVAVLIIACPCALGLATPTAIMVGSGRGAELGVLFKNPEVFERVQALDVILFDKTGTLTTGAMTLTDLETDEDKAAFLAKVAAVELASGHPIGKAVALGAEQRGLVVGTATTVEALGGRGVIGAVDGTTVVVGTPKLITDRGLLIPDRMMETLRRWESEGKTAFLAAYDGEVRGALAVADTLRAGSRQAVDTLNRMGLETGLVTGDNHLTAAAIAAQVGVGRVLSEVLPADKVDEVTRVQAEGKQVAFVGDGINDAPALVAADLGVAIGTGTDVAVEAADVVLMSGDPGLLPVAVALARRTLRIIKENLFWAFGYNVAAIPLAAAGVLDPMVAAGAMALSSVSVVTNSLRLRRFRPD